MTVQANPDTPARATLDSASLGREIERLHHSVALNSGFAWPIEQAYGEWLHAKAMFFLRQYLHIIVFVYLASACLTGPEVWYFSNPVNRPHEMHVFGLMAAALGVVTLFFFLCARRPQMDGWFWLYSGLADTLMISVMALGITAFRTPQFSQINMSVLIIGFVVTFGTGLQPLRACITIAIAAGALTLLLRQKLGLPLDLDGFAFYYGMVGLIMLLLCHFMARTHRLVFLQERLLLNEQEDLRVLSQKMSWLSLRDPLTDLANRRHFDDALDQEWERAYRDESMLSLLFIDVDHFKDYNDCYGHQAGDTCLQIVARTLGEISRRPGDVAARYGGEEFVLLLPNTDESGALEVGERIRAGIVELGIPHKGSPFGRVTVSVGVTAMVPRLGGSTTDTLVNAADKAVYIAKGEGRNQVAIISAG